MTMLKDSENLILQDAQVKTDDPANQMLISHGSSYNIIYNILNFNKVQQWVPRQLTELHKEKCLLICHFLDHYDKEGDTFLERIVTEDKTWMYHYGPENKCQSME